MSERKTMMQGHQRLAVSRPCQLLAVPRSSVYTRARETSAADLTLMRQLDELYLKWPFYDSRRLCEELRQREARVNRKRVRRLMRQMGLRAVYPKPRTSHPGRGHTISPYLLTGLTIDRPNQVWASDWSSPDGQRLYVSDRHHGLVFPPGARLAGVHLLDAAPCIAALEEALVPYGPPEIFNPDQGVQYTSEAFTAVLRSQDIRISMDGKDRWVDNVLVERLWRRVKYEDISLRAYESPAALRRGLPQSFQFYHAQRRQQMLNRPTPDAVYFGHTKKKTAA